MLMRWMFCLLLVAAVYSVSAQKSWKDARVWMKNGDTLRGQIFDRQWRMGVDTIELRSSGQVSSLTPTNTYKVQIMNGPTYLSATLSFDMTPTEMRSLVEEGNEVYETKTVFLREIYLGARLSLYELPGYSKTHYVIADASGQLKELTYQMLYVAGEQRRMTTNNGFRGQLLAYLPQATEKVRSRILQLSYSAEDLLWAMAQINNDQRSSREVRKGLSRQLKISPFVAAGAGLNSVRMSPRPRMGIPPSVPAAQSFAFYAGVDLGETTSNRALFARFSFLADRYALNGPVNLPTSTINYRSEISKSRQAISLNYQRRWGRMAIYGGAGAGLLLLRHRNVEGYPDGLLPRPAFSPQVQAGFRFRPAFIHFEYHLNSGSPIRLQSGALVAGIYL